MKWINHKITTFSIVFLVTHNLIPSFLAAMGSVIPDAIEGHNYNSDRWRKNHRRFSHWLFGYFLICLILAVWFYAKFKIFPLYVDFLQVPKAFKVFNSETVIYLLVYSGFFVILGAALHIVEDALSNTVPLLHPTKRTFTFGLCRVGSWQEYLISFGLLFISLVKFLS